MTTTINVKRGDTLSDVFTWQDETARRSISPPARPVFKSVIGIMRAQIDAADNGPALSAAENAIATGWPEGSS